MPLIIKVINPLNYYTGISGSVTGTGSSGVERVRLWFPFITY
jgi:hypothetical protein